MVALLATVVLVGCNQQQVTGGVLEAAMLAAPDDAHNCLHGVLDASNGDAEGTCWALIHLRYAQHFCKQALEAEVPKPSRWEEQSVRDPVLKTLIRSVPGNYPQSSTDRRGELEPGCGWRTDPGYQW